MRKGVIGIDVNALSGTKDMTTQPRKAVNLMREEKIRCARCGKNHSKIFKVEVDYPETVDLCEECLDKLNRIIRAYCKKGENDA